MSDELLYARVSDLKPYARLFVDATGPMLVDATPIVELPESGPAPRFGTPPGEPAGGSPVVTTGEAVRAALRRVAGLTEWGLPTRPKPRPADRSAARPTNPEPPPAWSAPPHAKLAARPPGPILPPAWPAAFGDTQAASIRAEMKTSIGVVATEFRVDDLTWDRIDLETGQPGGDPETFWTWATSPLIGPGPPEPPVVGLSPEGSLLALRDPASPDRVDVWDATGRHLVGFVPRIEGRPVRMIGRDATGRLLTVAGGSPSAWPGWRPRRATVPSTSSTPGMSDT